MHKQLTAFFAATLVATLALLLGLTPAASAQPPRNVHDGRHASIEAGWVRVACATRDDAVKCTLRFPADLSRVDLRYMVAGTEVAVSEATGISTRPSRLEGTPSMNRRVLPGVRFVCTGRGSRAACDFVLARRRDFDVVLYVGGEHVFGYQEYIPRA